MNDIEQAIIGMRGLKELLPPLLLKFNYENLGKEDAIEVVEHLNLAISALEKQVAKKPSMKAMDGFSDEQASILSCYTCGNPVINYWKTGTNPKYCQFCGQKLDWEASE